MDIRQLNYFISVAEHLNFTKAAKHHFIAQTAISQQIMALEQQLGVKLFERSNKAVKLTTAGKVFYQEAKLIVSRSEEAVRRTLQAARGTEGALKVGFIGPNEKWFLPGLIRNFRHAYPAVDLTITQENLGKLREDLEHGMLDVIFNVSYGIEKLPAITWKPLYKDPMCAIVYRDHPIANETKISRASLSNEHFVFIERKEAPLGYDSMVEDCIKSGFMPKITHQTRFFETVLLMVEAEMGITMLPRSFEVYKSDNLRFVELEGESTEVGVSWRKDSQNPITPLFVNVVEEQFSNTVHTVIHP